MPTTTTPRTTPGNRDAEAGRRRAVRTALGPVPDAALVVDPDARAALGPEFHTDRAHLHMVVWDDETGGTDIAYFLTAAGVGLTDAARAACAEAHAAEPDAIPTEFSPRDVLTLVDADVLYRHGVAVVQLPADDGRLYLDPFAPAWVRIPDDDSGERDRDEDDRGASGPGATSP